MDEKLPYYMAYPMPLLYDDERQNQRDYEYMKSVYPGTAKRLMPYIEEECDRLEYTGSVMYDEYPDRLRLYRLAMDILDRVKREENSNEESAPDADSPEKWQRIGDLIQILLFYEIYKRRHRDERFTHLFI